MFNFDIERIVYEKLQLNHFDSIIAIKILIYINALF